MDFKIDEGTAAVLLRMSGEARHQCIDAMMMFVFCGEDKEPEDPTAAAAYGFMKMAEVSKASAAENGKKGGRPKKTNDGDTTEEGGDVVAVPTEAVVERFSPPSVEDVAEYCESRHNGIDAERFVNYYQSKGWKVGSRKMKDWRAAVRTWEAKERERAVGSRSAEADDVLRDALKEIQQRE